MNSRLTDEFIAAFAALPDRIKRLARRNYRLWSQNPSHPSLDFKRVGKSVPVYSIRVGIGWRALGVHDESDDTITWFWIGSPCGIRRDPAPDGLMNPESLVR